MGETQSNSYSSNYNYNVSNDTSGMFGNIRNISNDSYDNNNYQSNNYQSCLSRQPCNYGYSSNSMNIYSGPPNSETNMRIFQKI